MILSEDANRFEKIIFRISKGKVLTIIEDLNIEEEGEKKVINKKYIKKKIYIYILLFPKLLFVLIKKFR